MPSQKRFVGKETTFILLAPGGDKAQQLIWGDFVTLADLPAENGWVKVRGRGVDGWLREADLQREQLLEICFVDIGQGDGTLIVTPDDEFLLVDAGEKDNMFRFLTWRFNLRSHIDRTITFKAAVISHPDQDHYGGFQPLFDSPNFHFETLYHNGIVERTGADPLGSRTKVGGQWYLTAICSEQDDVAAVVTDDQLAGRKKYPKLLRTAIQSGRVSSVRGISSGAEFLDGFGPGGALQIEVLGPVLADLAEGPALPWFDTSAARSGKTKNGHSVILKLTYGSVRVLLGGDLNSESERYLLQHYTGLDPAAADRDALIAGARGVFGCDVAKACHHGSADFTTEFLEAMNVAATVVSSGDDEPHCHPRPDTLGAVGKASRGARPLIYSTELARSGRDGIQRPNVLRGEIRDLVSRIDETEDSVKKAEYERKLEKLLQTLERSVAVYGMITLRSDGTKVLMAQKLEQARPTGEEFDVQILAPGPDGVLALRSR